MTKKADKIISAGEPISSCLNGDNLRLFKRDVGIPEKPENVQWLYFVWLCSKVGLNGPDSTQQYIKKENQDKTYFELALKLFKTRFMAFVPNDDNRVSDARCLRDEFALSESSFTDYSVLDTEGASMLEVMIALCKRFDNDVMMTENGIDRSKEWFWEMLKNCDLDTFVDSEFMSEKNLDNSVGQECDAIIKRVNDREYEGDGKGGFFPLKHPKCDQRKVQLWMQIHSYFLENHIE